MFVTLILFIISVYGCVCFVHENKQSLWMETYSDISAVSLLEIREQRYTVAINDNDDNKDTVVIARLATCNG